MRRWLREFGVPVFWLLLAIMLIEFAVWGLWAR